MGKKYIIELESGTHIFILGPEGIVHIGEPDVVYNTVDGMQIGDAVINAKPYTEPDLGQVRKKAYKIGYEKGYRDGVNRIGDAEDKIRKEAYEEGKKQAKVQAELDVSHDIEKVARENYKAGLYDAWEAARKIIRMPEGDLLELFDVYSSVCTPVQVMLKYDASECIEKIRQYEQEKEEQIQVGDEVIRHYKNEFMEGDDAPSIFLSEEDGHFRCLAFNGRSIMIAEYPKNQYRKTGRHFPEITAVLEKMRGEQDG